MSNELFQIALAWQPHNKPFNYNEYSREYAIASQGKPTLTGTAAPEYKGSHDAYNPEEMLIMALSACHMLSYLALAANSKIEVLAYEDNAKGSLHKEDNIIKFKEVILCPKIKISANSDADKALALHNKAHHICFIANSVNFPIEIQAEIIPT